MRSRHLIIGSAVILALIAGGIVGFARNRDAASEAELVATRLVSTSTTPDLAERIAQPTPPPEGYIEYRNEQYGFSFYHSQQSEIIEYDEGGGAMTVVLQNKQKVRGLQVFIVPYAEDKITEERFRMDVPSDVRVNVEPTRIGIKQIEAVTFNSYDELLGETREVWFIYDGHLYEITTFKGMGNWLAPILQSWRFTD